MRKKIKTRKNKTEKINYKDLVYKYNLLAELMEHIPDVIYFKDRKGKLLMVNSAHARGLGLKPEEVVGKTDFDFHPKKKAEKMTKDDRRVMKTGKPIIDKIERATRADGVDNYVSTTKIPRYDKKGRIVGLVGITRDITSRMQVEHLREEKIQIERKLQALEELNNMKSEFVSIISHELRTPLAIIKEAVMLIFDEITGPLNNKQKEFLVKAKDNVERLKKIIDELLDVSRIEKGKLKLHYSLVNLNDLLLDSCDFFRRLAQERDIHLEYHLPKDQVNIFVDASRINQVIANIVNNAIKFTEQNGKIKLDLQILESKVRIGVIDTGVGIAREDLPKLFEKFVQVSRSTSTERKGVGLGLPIAKELIERHGGEIWIESKVGVGTKCYFTLSLFYTQKVLSKDIRDTINGLLSKGLMVYLVNLLIVNFEEFKKRTRLQPKKLFGDLEKIISVTFQDFSKKKETKHQMGLQDYQNGDWSVLLPETKEAEVTRLCGLLKDRLNGYFEENRVKNIFINLGIMAYSREVQTTRSKKLRANIDIKKIYIGSEIRQFKRIDYRTDIDISVSDDKRETSQTMDISEGGVCFVSENQLETDRLVSIGLRLPNARRSFNVKGRVAWRKNIEEGPVSKYKIGLEFVGLESKDRTKLSKFIKSIAT